MTLGLAFFLIFALLIKHLIVDFPVYSGYICKKYGQSKNDIAWKIHILGHGVGTAFILLLVGIPVIPILILAAIDMVSHYVIDSIVVHVIGKLKTDQFYQENLFWVPELDQFLHCLIYVGMIFLLVFLI